MTNGAALRVLAILEAIDAYVIAHRATCEALQHAERGLTLAADETPLTAGVAAFDDRLEATGWRLIPFDQ